MRGMSNTIIAFLAIILMFVSLIGNVLVVELAERNMEISGYSTGVGTVGVSVTLCGNGVCDSGETCSSCPGDCGVCPVIAPGEAAVGGGAGGKKIVRDFIIEPDIIKVSLKQGQTITKLVSVTNTGNSILDISVDLGDLAEFILLSDEYFRLGVGESKTLTLDFTASIDEVPDVYADIVIFDASGVKKGLRVILEIESRKALFDAILKIPEEYKQVVRGSLVVGDIELINMGDLMPVDILVNYAIKDFNGQILHQEHETLAVNDRLKYSKALPVPYSALEGKYIYYIKVDYENQSAVSSDTFDVVRVIEKPKVWKTYSFWILWLIILILIILNIIFWIKRKKKKSDEPLSLLYNVIDDRLRRGFSLRQIEEGLIKKRWPRNIVKKALKRFR